MPFNGQKHTHQKRTNYWRFTSVLFSIWLGSSVSHPISYSV